METLFFLQQACTAEENDKDNYRKAGV